MPDEMDAVQERTERESAAAVRAALARRMVVDGTCVCGCGEAVELPRLAIGVCRTLECQRRHEARERNYAHGHR